MPHQQTKQKKILFGLAAHTLKKQDQLLAAFGQNVVGNLERQFGAEGRGLKLKKEGIERTMEFF